MNSSANIPRNSMRVYQQLLLVLIVLGFNSIPSTASACCKICTTGKACGDTCISAAYTCHQPPGCACNGGAPSPPNSSPNGKPNDNSGTGNNSSNRPTSKPKYSQTSGAIAASISLLANGDVLCGYIPSGNGLAWVPGRILNSGKFLALKTEIRNVTYLVNFHSSTKKASFEKIRKKLKNLQKTAAVICLLLGPPY